MINHDQSELDHFSQQANTWWNPNGPMRTLHDINPTRLSFVLQHTALSEKRVCDIGCGAGILTEALAKAGANTIVGIDMAEALIHTAQAHANESQLTIDYRVCSAESLAIQAPASMDVITCMEMLEHVPDPEAIIQACSQLLAPNGWLFVSTLNRTLQANLLGVWAAEQLLRIVPKGTHDANKFIAPNTLTRWARQNQLVAKDLTGLHYNPMTHRAHLALPASINYLMAFQKPAV